MAITINTQNNSEAVVNKQTLFLTTDATAATLTIINVGFVPRTVRVFQVSGSGAPAIWEYFDGQTAGTALQTITAGTNSVLGSGGITISPTYATGNLLVGFPTGSSPVVGQRVDTAISLGAALVPASSTLAIEIEG